MTQRVSDMWVTAHLLELAAWLASGSEQSAVLAARWGGFELPAGRARELLRELRRRLGSRR